MSGNIEKNDEHTENIRKKAGIIAITLVCFSFVLCLLWNSGAFLPGWIRWDAGEYWDLSGNYKAESGHRTVSVFYQGRNIWNSPKGVKVQKALVCDIDRDQQDELVLLCWKKGRYGKDKPFWVEDDEKGWSQHLFVYEYVGDEVRVKWMSSYIGQDVADIRTDDLVSSVRRLWLLGTDGEMSSFIWDSWGFVKEDTDISFVALGDNLIHEPIYRYGLQKEGDFDYLYENFGDIIAQSDVAIINQETPLTDQPSMYGDYPRFGTPVQVGEAIVNAGFDVVTCATNHALDRGADGVDFTKDFFASRGIKCLGIQAQEEKEEIPYEIITRKGVRFALLNYTYGTNGLRPPEENPYMVHVLADEAKVRENIGKARAEADLVIIFVHWGTEYAQKIDEFQQKWAQIFLESKADVVVGTHPHTIQPVEVLVNEDGHEMVVYYSIGNFVSAQSEKSCTKGGLASFTISLGPEGYHVAEYSLQPLTITWQEGGKYVTVLPNG